ncbi:MAG: nicotinamide mononucleotide transporter family protein [Bacillales bacterium]|jgi:nicotinamide riboside transporter PnuC|nr:nicotinamide mononucleotide transporter family protein [Bacillales bacterium]
MKIKIFNICCICLTLILITLSHIFLPFQPISILSDFATLSGVLYSAFLITKKKYSLHLGVINNVLLGISTILQHVWLTAFICLIYSVPSLLIAVIRNRATTEAPIKTLNIKQALLSFLVYLSLSGLFMIILYLLKGNLWYLDAFVNAGLILALFFITKNNYYCYYFFTISALVGVIMYVLLTIQDSSNSSLIILWFIYLMGDIVGLINWKSKYKKQGIGITDCNYSG